MLLVTKKKNALKKFLYTYSFYTMEEYLSQSWIKYCITRSLLWWYIDLRFCIWALCKYTWIVFKFCLDTLCMYLLIVFSEWITFPCINLICLIYVLESQLIIICISLSRLFLHYACCYLIIADDTSILFAHSNLKDFNKNIHIVFAALNKLFRANQLSLNFSKTNYVHF
jgi:hypothetical protein